MAHYSCPQCRYTVADPVCPSCNRFLSDDVVACEAFMKPILPDLPDTMEWCTAFGHWGDIFCCVGVMQAYMRQTGQKQVNVLYVGPDLDIVDWLEAQPCVGKVIGIKSARGKDGEFYEKFWYQTAQPNATPYDWWPMLYQQMRGLPPPEAYTQTHINAQWFETRIGLPAQLWHEAEMTDAALHSAAELLQTALPHRTGKVIHLHPVSTWSEAQHNHWAHWLAAIEWLVEKTPHTYVLTGLAEIPFLPQSPRIINLIGKTKSNLHVLAISQFCDAVISTPNSIALWTVIQKQKCLTIGNLATQYMSSYYRRFLERGETLTYLNVDTSFSGFQAAACAFFEEG